MNYGNQHRCRRVDLLFLLQMARSDLCILGVDSARARLRQFWRLYGQAPASTRRRWKCGR